MTETQQRCSCGRPLHYSDPAIQGMIEDLVQAKGPTIPVQVEGADQAYRVPRHFIALHGLVAVDLAELAARYGWERIR